MSRKKIIVYDYASKPTAYYYEPIGRVWVFGADIVFYYVRCGNTGREYNIRRNKFISMAKPYGKMSEVLYGG